MSCLICNELLHDTITCGLIFYVSHINTISSPKVVTQLPKPNKDLLISPFFVIDDNSTKIWKLSSFGLYATYPTFKLYVRIWICTTKSDLVVITPPTYLLKWFGFKLTHMHEYENYGRVSTTK
jgi:hypothetical protein